MIPSAEEIYHTIFFIIILSEKLCNMEIKKMKNIKKNNILPNVPESCALLSGHTLFLDIETTGFSRAKSQLYLAGAAYIQGGALVSEQFFAESPEEEPQLITALDNLMKQAGTVVTFYGNHFDLPFLEACRNRLGIPALPRPLHSADLYDTARAYRYILGLENYKLQTLERYLGIHRTNPDSGGDLVRIYQRYITHPQEEPAEILLKHNLDDLLGTVRLLSLTALDTFFNGGLTPETWTLSAYRKMDGSDGTELTVSCGLQEKLPAAISCNNDNFYLHADKDRAFFRIPVLEGTLKYFYPDYKNYYYLPDEDLAIHKSVASYVDPSHREKASAANCYSKKAGEFLPQYEEVFTPALFTHYKAPVSYFETGQLGNDAGERVRLYCMHILRVLKKGG